MYLTHCYAHTSKHVKFLSESLKGADMSLWNTAKALDLKSRVVPVMTTNYSYYHDGVAHLVQPAFHPFNGGGTGSFEFSEMGARWGNEMPEDKVTWLNESGSGRDKSEDKSK